ncbi:MAG: hypothetical protein U5L10_02750 [Candidatus Moranbacteria bacterium]|nr:hypothetical protein [Candidatus Moranbacteria bacterium]
MNLYLDIDGVLLDKNNNPANHLEEFLAYATENFDCHWLTTHCKGDAAFAVERFREVGSARILELVKKIKPTDWERFKTDAIDFNKPFIWLDDYPGLKEEQTLEEKSYRKNLIKIDLKSNPDILKELMGKS